MGSRVGIGGADIMMLSAVPHFLTGSRAYGVVCHDSDFDIAVTVVDFDRVLNFFDREWTTPSEYFRGVKFRVKGAEAVINLIPLSPRDFSAWYYATLAMPENVGHKTLRHSVFTLFVQGYRLTLDMPTLAKLADWWNDSRPRPRKELADAIDEYEAAAPLFLPATYPARQAFSQPVVPPPPGNPDPRPYA